MCCDMCAVTIICISDGELAVHVYPHTTSHLTASIYSHVARISHDGVHMSVIISPSVLSPTINMVSPSSCVRCRSQLY